MAPSIYPTVRYPSIPISRPIKSLNKLDWLVVLSPNPAMWLCLTYPGKKSLVQTPCSYYAKCNFLVVQPIFRHTLVSCCWLYIDLPFHPMAYQFSIKRLHFISFNASISSISIFGSHDIILIKLS